VTVLSEDASGAGWRTVLLIVGAALLVQLLLQAWFFPAGALNSEVGLAYIDAPFHQYQMEVARALCVEGRAMGYDPYFAAGHVGGVSLNASAKLPALLSCLSDASVAVVYKHVSFWSGVLAPALPVLACGMLRLPALASVLAALLSLMLWWTGPLRWYHAAGLIAYVLVAFAAVPFVLLLIRTFRYPSLWGVVATGLVAALGFLVHPLFAVATTLLALPLAVSALRGLHRPWNSAAALAAIALSMLVLNAYWLYSSLEAPNFASVDNPYQRIVDPLLMLHEMLGSAGTAAGGSRLYIALLIGTGLCWACFRGPNRPLLLALTASAGLLMTWASLGSALKGIAALQPNRFSAMAWLSLVPPASAGATAALSALRDAAAQRRWILGAALAGMGLVMVVFLRETGSEVFASADRPRYAVSPPEVKGQGPLSADLVEFLRSRTDQNARVFFENSLGRVHDRGHMAGLYAWTADREFIGGPYPFTDFASAWDGYAFGRSYEELAPAALAPLLDAYNVRWMLCHSGPCKQAMSALPDVQAVGTWESVTAFERTKAPGFVAEGRARIATRCVNRIDLADVEGPRLVLRYHWVPGLVGWPEVTIEPVELVPGARPFISVRHPPRQLTLRMGTGAGVPCEARGGDHR